MLHFTGIMTSCRPNFCILSGLLGGCDSFHSWLVWGCGWMLWLVGSLFLTSMSCPAITPIMCGLYWQPFWSSVTAVVGTCHVWSGRPDLIHTNTYFNVPLSLTTASSVFAGEEAWALVQAGTADISMLLGVGFAPSKLTLPVIVAPLARSGVPVPPPAGAAVGSNFFAVSGGLPPPPHPASDSTQAIPNPIQIFFML